MVHTNIKIMQYLYDSTRTFLNTIFRSTTLEDIYRHYDTSEDPNTGSIKEDKKVDINNQASDKKDGDLLSAYKSSTITPLKHRGQHAEEIYIAEGKKTIGYSISMRLLSTLIINSE